MICHERNGFELEKCKTEAFSLVISDLIVSFQRASSVLLKQCCFSFYAGCIFCSSCLTGGQAAGIGQTVLLSLPVASARSVRETGCN